jgi:MFS family permease
MALILGAMNAVTTMALATYVLFVQEVLGLGAASFGALLTAGAAGGVVGSVAAAGVSRRIGPGASLFTSLLGCAVSFAVTGLTSSWWVVWAMFAAFSFLSVLWNVITVSLRQAIIPDRLLGRVNSVYRFFAWGMMPLGSVAGGLIVAATAMVTGRMLALRMPYLVGAGIYAVLFLASLPVLTTRNIEAARAAAGKGRG